MTLYHRVVLINVAALACVAAAAAYGFAVSGSGDGTVAVPVPDALASGYCRALHDALPQRIEGLSRHDLNPASELTAGWGDGEIVLRCGVPRPAADSSNQSYGVGVDGVDWSVEHGSGDSLRLTTTFRQAYVEVTMPDKYASGLGPLLDLADPVKRTVPGI